MDDELKDYDKEAFDRPSVTVDVAICTIIDNRLKVLLIKRKQPPFRNRWALPGGFVRVDLTETLEETAQRVLKDKTSLSDLYIEQLMTFGDPSRDPRMRIITVAYFALLPYEKILKMRIDLKRNERHQQWFDLRRPPDKLAFDHRQILEVLLQRLIGKISYMPIAFNLVPENFTWSELQRVYEIVLGTRLITPNFRRKIKELYSIKELKGKRKTKDPGRPAVYLKYMGIKRPY